MARVEQWQAEDPETTQDIAETRKLVQLAAQRCIELRTAVELAKADYQGSPEGTKREVSGGNFTGAYPAMRPASVLLRPASCVLPARVARFSSAPVVQLAPQMPMVPAVSANAQGPQ
ncbi:unnamed protein product, partial [Effrenium voratum]